MRAKLFVVVAALGLTASAAADILENFEIVTASGFSTTGGLMTYGDTFGAHSAST